MAESDRERFFTSRFSSPARSSSPRIPSTPPARCIFHMVLLRARRHFTQLRNLAGQLIDITHSEVDFRFCAAASRQNGIRRTAHGNIRGHGVFKRRFAGDVARQRGCIILLVIALSQLNDAFPRVEEQLLTVGVSPAESRYPAGTDPALRSGQFIELAVKHPSNKNHRSDRRNARPAHSVRRRL